jgi:hypothetical protein
MATIIEPGDLAQDIQLRLVPSASNPGNCPCGWYIYISNTCGHTYTDYPHRCGNKVTPSGKSGFCKSPAPRNLVRGAEINANCVHC